MSISRLALLVVVVFLIAGGSAFAGDEKTGKEIFLEHSCDGCHAVTVAGIVIPPSEEELEEGEEEEEAAPDLSGVGNRHEADFIHLYLRKKEMIDEKKHRKRFKGKKAERAVLVDWLMTLEDIPVETDPAVPETN